MKITKTSIDAMRFEGGHDKAKDVRADDELAGFGVRVWPSGKKTFIYEYRFRNRKRYLTIGKYGAVTLQQARDLARQASAEVTRGADPQAAKEKLRQGETMKDLGLVYIQRHAKAHNKSWAKDQERLERFIDPAFGTIKVDAIRRQDIARLHQRIGEKHPTTANRVLALLSSMFNRARLDFGFLPASHPNPTEGIKRFSEVKRERFVEPHEMPKLARAIDAEKNIFIKALIWLYLFTGMRKNELKTLTWMDIDLTAARIHLGDTKAGRPHHLPISPMAAEILRAIPRVIGNVHVFCGARYGQPIVNVDDAWQRIRKAAKLEDVRLHDLRRTLGSWMAQGGYSLPLIGRTLNHSNQATTAVYARFHLDPIAEALEATGRKIQDATHDPAPTAKDVGRETGSEVD